MMENRIDRDENPMLLAIWQAKRAALLNVRDSPNGEWWQLFDDLRRSMQQEMSIESWVQAQAMLNALTWAANDIEDI